VLTLVLVTTVDRQTGDVRFLAVDRRTGEAFALEFIR
jgi:hypothetical protein